ncbi:MAG TPA: hypothetical protein VHK01_20840 [Lacipirellulaceae bacterium]|nr:hypothetical protein [Lacipirellulaceae bacterium]
MPRCVLATVIVFAALQCGRAARAVDFFWTGPDLGGPGGNFRNSNNWTFTPPPFPLSAAPGGEDDTANFDLGRSPASPYTVTGVGGQNDRLIVHDDSLTLVVSDSSLGVDYALVNNSEASPSLTIGLSSLDVADLTLRGANSTASISTETTSIGRSILSTGVLTVDNLQWDGDGDVIVGESGTGTLTIQNGSDVTSDQGLLGLNYVLDLFGIGTVVVTGAGSTWTNDLDVWVGGEGAGTLRIEDGGRVENATGFIGTFDGSFGTVTVTGAGSTWHNSSQLQVGSHGTGTLTISGGGSVSNSQGFVGSFDGSMGTVTVIGAGSTWNNVGELRVGADSDGELTISNGGSVTNTVGRIGDGPDVTGAVTVTGPGSTWTSSENLYVADAGDGTLVISRGGNVENSSGRIGDQSGSAGTVTVTGPNSTWTNNSGIIVGFAGDGELTIEAGGSATSVSSITLGFTSPSTGEVTVTGAGSNMATNLSVSVGQSGTGQLTISGGGSVSAGFNSSVGGNPSSTGTATVAGAGSSWTVADTLSVGFFGMGTLDVENCGSVSSAEGIIGREQGSTGTVTVTGNGSSWTIGGRLSMGGIAATGADGGNAQLNIHSGGTVDVAEDTVIFDNGFLFLQGGTLATTGISGGSFIWSSGTLHVGIFDGDLTNPSDGTLAPGRSAGGTTILGDYTQSAGATLEIEIGGTATATQFDFVDITGTATLGGELQLALINGFVPDPEDEFIVFNAGDLLSFFTNAGNGQRVETIDGVGSFLVHYGPTSIFNPNQIVLSEFAPARVPSDYNGDGVVDAADYVVWRKYDGSQAGYDLWRANFGATVGSGAEASSNAAVPEPTTLFIVLVGTLATSIANVRQCHKPNRR